MSDRTPIRRALLGVYDKTGIEELAAGLAAAGVELVSTGATARRIADAGIPVTPVEQVTGFPECLDGRVKTLQDRKSTRLNSSHANISYAVFCLKKKTKIRINIKRRFYSKGHRCSKA